MEDYILVLIEEYEVKEKRIQEEEGEIVVLWEVVIFVLDLLKLLLFVVFEELQD